MKVYFTSFLFAMPLFAIANAGSPIIWFNLFHLFIANAVIGITESVVLDKYKLANKMWVIIIANYISMAIGFYIILPAIATTQYGRDIWTSDDLFSGILVSFFITLIIEYPLFIASLKDKSQRRMLFKPFLIANIITNVIMICFYFLFV